jgi:four helix bundle protein
MSIPKSYSDNLIWQKANKLVLDINSFSDELPHEELYEVKMRLKNSIASLPDKIAESIKVQSKIEYIRMRIKANSHLEECKDYLEIIENLKFGNTAQLKQEIEEISNLLIRSKLN